MAAIATVGVKKLKPVRRVSVVQVSRVPQTQQNSLMGQLLQTMAQRRDVLAGDDDESSEEEWSD